MKYQLTIWLKEQKFNDPKVPDIQVVTSNVKLINDYLTNNWINIRKHNIICVDTGETTY